MEIKSNLENIDWFDFLNYLSTFTSFDPAKEEIKKNSVLLKEANYKLVESFVKYDISFDLKFSSELTSILSSFPDIAFSEKLYTLAVFLQEAVKKINRTKVRRAL